MLFTAEVIYGEEARTIGLVEVYGRRESELIDAILANDRESLLALKQAIALAAGGVRSDAGQDRRFDALIAGEEMARRLEAMRRK